MRQSTARAAGKRGFTLIELLVVVAIIALLISILMPSLARARELSKRTVCASNVKGFGVGFASYAAANNDAWPVPTHPSQGNTDVSTEVQYVNALGAKRGSFLNPAEGETFDGLYGGKPKDTVISTTRALWELVRGGSTPKSFVCPSATTDQPNAEDSPQSYWDFGTGDRIGTSTTPDQAYSKGAWQQVSYGYQVPFGNNGRPSPNVDPDMALLADKGPYSAAHENGSAMPNPLTASGAPNISSTSEEWKKYNSTNHGGVGDGEGQNVMYNDGHAEFFTTPNVGTGKDNIYTQWATANAALEGRTNGIAPALNSRLAPRGQTDSLIYP